MEERKNSLNKIFALGLLLIVFVLFVQLIVGMTIYILTGNDWGGTKSTSDTIDVDWDELYPFQEDLDQAADNEISESSIVNSLISKYSSIMDQLQTVGDICGRHIYKYSEVANCGYILNSFLSDPGTNGRYIRLNNGYWTTVEAMESDHIVTENVNAVIDFYNYLDHKNIPFLYIQPAVKNCQYDSKLPVGVEDYTNTNIDDVLDRLEAAGIECLDMRKSLHEEYDDHYELFYVTDHHWTFEAGLWVSGIIENEVESRFKINFETSHTDFTEYRKQTYENAVFGPAGQAVTHFIEDSEDLSVYFPLFETDFKLTVPDKGIDTEGSFEEIFVDYTTLETVIDEGGGYAYETILYGNRPLVQIKNLNNENGPKVLLIRDSFSIAVAPYLAIGCSELDLLDVRPTMGNFSGSIRSYVEQTNPDIVIMMIIKPGQSYK